MSQRPVSPQLGQVNGSPAVSHDINTIDTHEAPEMHRPRRASHDLHDDSDIDEPQQYVPLLQRFNVNTPHDINYQDLSLDDCTQYLSGIVVEVEGNIGCGKSTLTKFMTKILNNHVKGIHDEVTLESLQQKDTLNTDIYDQMVTSGEVGEEYYVSTPQTNTRQLNTPTLNTPSYSNGNPQQQQQQHPITPNLNHQFSNHSTHTPRSPSDPAYNTPTMTNNNTTPKLHDVVCPVHGTPGSAMISEHVPIAEGELLLTGGDELNVGIEDNDIPGQPILPHNPSATASPLRKKRPRWGMFGPRGQEQMDLPFALVHGELVNSDFLASFYADPKHYGFAFQTYMLTTRLFQIEGASKNAVEHQQFAMLDRAAVGDALFATFNHSCGNISDIDMTIYEAICNGNQRSLSARIDVVAYLDVSPLESFRRMNSIRQRDAEKEVVPDYIEGIDNAYFELMVKWAGYRADALGKIKIGRPPAMVFLDWSQFGSTQDVLQKIAKAAISVKYYNELIATGEYTEEEQAVLYDVFISRPYVRFLHGDEVKELFLQRQTESNNNNKQEQQQPDECQLATQINANVVDNDNNNLTQGSNDNNINTTSQTTAKLDISSLTQIDPLDIQPNSILIDTLEQVLDYFKEIDENQRITLNRQTVTFFYINWGIKRPNEYRRLVSKILSTGGSIVFYNSDHPKEDNIVAQ